MKVDCKTHGDLRHPRKTDALEKSVLARQYRKEQFGWDQRRGQQKNKKRDPIAKFGFSVGDPDFRSIFELWGNLRNNASRR